MRLYNADKVFQYSEALHYAWFDAVIMKRPLQLSADCDPKSHAIFLCDLYALSNFYDTSDANWVIQRYIWQSQTALKQLRHAAGLHARLAILLESPELLIEAVKHIAHWSDIDRFQPLIDIVPAEYLQLPSIARCQIRHHIGYLCRHLDESLRGWTMKDTDVVVDEVFERLGKSANNPSIATRSRGISDAPCKPKRTELRTVLEIVLKLLNDQRDCLWDPDSVPNLITKPRNPREFLPIGDEILAFHQFNRACVEGNLDVLNEKAISEYAAWCGIDEHYLRVTVNYVLSEVLLPVLERS